MTEKEIEGLLEDETRYLSVPSPLTTAGNQTIAVYKKKPVTMIKYLWEMYDFLIDKEYNFYTRNDLILKARQVTLENGQDFGTNFRDVVITSHKWLASELLPIIGKEP